MAPILLPTEGGAFTMTEEEKAGKRGGLSEIGINFRAREGTRSSTDAGKHICADAVREDDPALTERIEAERDWHHRYPEYLADLTLVEARSTHTALAVARRGLKSAYEEFVVVSSRRWDSYWPGSRTRRAH